MLAELNDALDAAVGGGDVDRALRLLIQNIPRFPLSFELRRTVARIALAEGKSDDAVRILRRTADLEIDAGRLVPALACIKMLESNGEDASSHWSRLNSEVEERGFIPDRTTVSQAEPDLVAERPALDREGLLAVATELAGRDPKEPVEITPFTAVPLLTELPATVRHLAFQSLVLKRRHPGERLASPPSAGPVWLVRGSYRTDDGSVYPPPGTVMQPGDDAAKASSPAEVLGFTDTGWRALSGRDDAQAVIDALDARFSVPRAWNDSAFVAALDGVHSDGLLQSIRLARLNRRALIRKDGRVSGLVMVIEGELSLIDREDDMAVLVGSIKPGEVIGEAGLLGPDQMPFDIVARSVATLAWWSEQTASLLLDTSPEAHAFLTQCAEDRRRAVSVIDTGEVQLLDDDV